MKTIYPQGIARTECFTESNVQMLYRKTVCVYRFQARMYPFPGSLGLEKGGLSSVLRAYLRFVSLVFRYRRAISRSSGHGLWCADAQVTCVITVGVGLALRS